MWYKKHMKRSTLSVYIQHLRSYRRGLMEHLMDMKFMLYLAQVWKIGALLFSPFGQISNSASWLTRFETQWHSKFLAGNMIHSEHLMSSHAANRCRPDWENMSNIPLSVNRDQIRLHLLDLGQRAHTWCLSRGKWIIGSKLDWCCLWESPTMQQRRFVSWICTCLGWMSRLLRKDCACTKQIKKHQSSRWPLPHGLKRPWYTRKNILTVTWMSRIIQK